MDSAVGMTVMEMFDLMCKTCGEMVFADEEDLWWHIQVCHPELFEEVRNLETPYMLEICYDEL